jgi:hypothetical protein
VTWLSRLIRRDREQDERLATAEAQRDEAAKLLAESREVAKRNREHVKHNHFTDGFAAAFEERRRHA